MPIHLLTGYPCVEQIAVKTPGLNHKIIHLIKRPRAHRDIYWIERKYMEDGWWTTSEKTGRMVFKRGIPLKTEQGKLKE